MSRKAASMQMNSKWVNRQEEKSMEPLLWVPWSRSCPARGFPREQLQQECPASCRVGTFPFPWS